MFSFTFHLSKELHITGFRIFHLTTCKIKRGGTVFMKPTSINRKWKKNLHFYVNELKLQVISSMQSLLRPMLVMIFENLHFLETNVGMTLKNLPIMPERSLLRSYWIFSKLLWFWYHKNSYIFLIIILKFHALIPFHSEENIKNVSILLIAVVSTIKL